MSKHLRYEVRALAKKTGQMGMRYIKQVPDKDADLFSIYGKIGILNWEWLRGCA